jgi:hypothetical protein
MLDIHDSKAMGRQLDFSLFSHLIVYTGEIVHHEGYTTFHSSVHL